MAWNSQLTLTNVGNKDMPQKEHDVIVSDETYLYHMVGYHTYVLKDAMDHRDL